MSEITFEELQAELDRLEAKKNTGRFTAVQYRVIEYARGRNVEWRNIIPLFNSKFGTDFSASQLSNKWIYERDKYGRGE